MESVNFLLFVLTRAVLKEAAMETARLEANYPAGTELIFLNNSAKNIVFTVPNGDLTDKEIRICTKTFKKGLLTLNRETHDAKCVEKVFTITMTCTPMARYTTGFELEWPGDRSSTCEDGEDSESSSTCEDGEDSESSSTCEDGEVSESSSTCEDGEVSESSSTCETREDSDTSSICETREDSDTSSIWETSDNVCDEVEYGFTSISCRRCLTGECNAHTRIELKPSPMGERESKRPRLE